MTRADLHDTPYAEASGVRLKLEVRLFYAIGERRGHGSGGPAIPSDELHSS